MVYIHTSADTTTSRREAGPKIALQSFRMITGLGRAAVFIQLPRTHFTAAAAIQQQTNSRRAMWDLQWTLAHGGARNREDLCSQKKVNIYI